MNPQESRPAYELSPGDFWPYVGKRKYQERNAGIEGDNLRHYNFNRALLGTYNLVVIGGASLGLAVGLEKLFEALGKNL